jgi:hypothetical protein
MSCDSTCDSVPALAYQRRYRIAGKIQVTSHDASGHARPFMCSSSRLTHLSEWMPVSIGTGRVQKSEHWWINEWTSKILRIAFVGFLLPYLYVYFSLRIPLVRCFILHKKTVKHNIFKFQFKSKSWLRILTENIYQNSRISSVETGFFKSFLWFGDTPENRSSEQFAWHARLLILLCDIAKENVIKINCKIPRTITNRLPGVFKKRWMQRKTQQKLSRRPLMDLHYFIASLVISLSPAIINHSGAVCTRPILRAIWFVHNLHTNGFNYPDPNYNCV